MIGRTTLLSINLEFIQEETEDVDKGRTDKVLEKDLIAEIEAHTIIMVETEGIIKTIKIMVLEAIDLEIGITRIIDPITEGKIPTKMMAKEIDTEV